MKRNKQLLLCEAPKLTGFWRTGMLNDPLNFILRSSASVNIAFIVDLRFFLISPIWLPARNAFYSYSGKEEKANPNHKLNIKYEVISANGMQSLDLEISRGRRVRQSPDL